PSRDPRAISARRRSRVPGLPRSAPVVAAPRRVRGRQTDRPTDPPPHPPTHPGRGSGTSACGKRAYPATRCEGLSSLRSGERSWCPLRSGMRLTASLPAKRCGRPPVLSFLEKKMRKQSLDRRRGKQEFMWEITLADGWHLRKSWI
ncbi:hypothetical protein Nmel_016157, partial [Mimus melanotis]